jgi:hypothetical protein
LVTLLSTGASPSDVFKTEEFTLRFRTDIGPVFSRSCTGVNDDDSRLDIGETPSSPDCLGFSTLICQKDNFMLTLVNDVGHAESELAPIVFCST